MDLARVAAKALHNLQKVPDAGKYWSESLVERLDELTRSLGDDLDGIMVSYINILKWKNIGSRNGGRARRDNSAEKSFECTCKWYARINKRLSNKRMWKEI